MGQDLQAQITFDSRGQAALTLGMPEARIRSLTVPQGEEWSLYSLIGASHQGPELPFKVPGVWAEDSTPGPARHVPPVVVEYNQELSQPAGNSVPSPIRHKWGSENI